MTAGPDDIQMQDGGAGLESELVIATDVTIRGVGPGLAFIIQQAAGSARVLSVSAGATVTLSRVWVTGGDTSGNGAGILNEGTLTLDRVEVSGNLVDTRHIPSRLFITGAAAGGGVSNWGTLTVRDSVIVNNAVIADRSGITDGQGGGLHNRGTADLVNTTVAYNRVTTSGERHATGGGVANLGNGRLTVRFGTVFGNSVTADRSDLAHGGGIENAALVAALAQIGHTVSAGNAALWVAGLGIAQRDIDRPYQSLGYNLFRTPSATAFGIGATATDRTGLDPLLDALGDNGGPTRTFLARAGSPLIDTGDPSITTGADQRGLPRPSGGRVDVGAVEVQQPPPAAPPPPADPPPAGLPAPVAPVPIRTRVSAEGSIAGPTLTAYNPDGSVRFSTQPFGPNFVGGVRVAVGDVNGDGTEDVVAAAGPGGAPAVRVYNGADGSVLQAFNAFEDAFAGGVYVSVGDMNGDGRPDVIVTPDQGGGPRVRVLSGTDYTPLADFLGIDDPNFRGGARVSVGDVNRDGWTDLIVAAGFGGGPRVAVFDGSVLTSSRAKLTGDFFAFEEALRNGAYVAVGNLDGDGFADLIFGGGPGGAPRVLAVSGADIVRGVLTTLANFFAGDVNDRSGVTVGAGGVAQILAAPVSAAAGGGGVYDLAGTKLAGFRLPGGFVAGLPVKDANAGTGSGDDNFINNFTVITNLKGVYTASYQDSVFHTDGVRRPARLTVELTIETVTPNNPSMNPANEAAGYTFTGRVRVTAANVARTDVAVTGLFTILQFPNGVEKNQQGNINFAGPSSTASTRVTGSTGTYASAGVGGTEDTIRLASFNVDRDGSQFTSALPLVLRKPR